MTGTRVRIAAALDVAVVVSFAVIGRSSHDEATPGPATLTSETVGPTPSDVLRVAAPFLIGLACGWAAARAWRRPFDVVSGRTIWVVTVVVGMVLRRALFDDGIAFSFVVVASLFTGVLLIGWRVVAGRFSGQIKRGS